MDRRVIIFLVVTSPIVLVGVIAWVIYCAIASGWNIADAFYEKEKENG